MMEIDGILGRVYEIANFYHKLLLIVGQDQKSLSSTIISLSEKLGGQVVNLNANLAQALVEEPSRLRQLKAPKAVATIVEETEHDVVFLDHIDLLFSPSMQIDPLAVLKSVSRNRTVVSVWPGETDGKRLIHAKDWHPEYQSYQVDDFAVLSLEPGAA